MRLEAVIKPAGVRGSSIWASLQELAGRWAIPAIVLWAVLIRLWDLARPFIGDYAWNEVYYAYIAREFLNGDLLTQYDIHSGGTVYSTPLVPWLVFLGFKLFGVSEWAARAPILAFGLAALFFLYRLANILYGRRVAIISLLFAATAPGIVFFSRNVQLDGVMATLGFGAVLAMIGFRRSGYRIWLVLSLVLFTIAVFAKYSAVLFLPAIAWAWFADGTRVRELSSWAKLAGFLAIAIVPALLWLGYSVQAEHVNQAISSQQTQIVGASTSLDGVQRFLLRFDELSFNGLIAALLTIWPNLSNHLGKMIFYPGLVLSIVAFARLNSVKPLKPYLLLMLLIAPWYVQILYPRAWIANEYYDYPALLALCVLLAVLALRAFDFASQHGLVAARRLRVVAALAIGMVILSNAWDYRDHYHGSYYPWPLIEQPSPDYSAKKVASLNSQKRPVLTDLPFTLYYTEADRSFGTYLWWFDRGSRVPEAIRSRKFEYVAFMYPQPVEVIEALEDSNYTRIAPAGWQLERAGN